jgi:hypothetical protein
MIPLSASLVGLAVDAVLLYFLLLAGVAPGTAAVLSLAAAALALRVLGVPVPSVLPGSCWPYCWWRF